jgi:non-canonical (house-cleaning) NTP pyrophosphatase
MAEKIVVVVGSENPVKKRAVRDAFVQVFLPETSGVFGYLRELLKNIFNPEEVRIIGINAPSGVTDQPKTEQETYQGAFNRLQAIKQAQPDADYWIAVEGGVVDDGAVMEEIGYVLVTQKGNDRIFRGQVPRFEIPVKHAALVRQGMELGPANDLIMGKNNSKQSGGMAGEVTDQLMDREYICYIAAVFAFSSLKNNHFYQPN